MAKKKQPVESNSLTTKAKGLFDHIRHIREVQDPKYFDTLTDSDKKSWNNYMICRFLSMEVGSIESVNEIQRYSGLPAREFYKLCILITPKRRSFVPYIKSKNDSKWTSEIVDILRAYYSESGRNVVEYTDILTDDDIQTIVGMYGINEKEFKKMLRD